MSYRKLFNNTSRSSEKYLNIAMKTQKMCIKYTNRKCCLDVRSVRGAVTRGGEQRDSSQLASSPPTRRLSPPGVCSAALISDVPCSRGICHRQEWGPFECSFYLHQRKYKFPSMSFITRRASHRIPQLSRIYGFWQFGCGSVAKNSKVIVKQSLINSNLFVTDYCVWQETKNTN